MPWVRLVRVVLVMATSFVIAGSAAAVSLSDYVITSWTTKDGLPSDVIWSLAQDREGYLWLGTNGGLVRFDGVQFTAVEAVGEVLLPRASVRTVYTARDGSLWIGFAETGGVSRIADHTLKNYSEAHGLPRTIVTALVEDRDGRFWAGTTRGLYVLAGDHWEAAGRKAGLSEARIDSLYVDRPGNLLVGTNLGVYRRATGVEGFDQVDALNDVAPTFRAFGEDAAGRVWMTDPLVAFRRLGDPVPVTRGTDRGRGNRLLFDREGCLWVATMGEGLWRSRHDGAGRRTALEKTRVSGARTLFEDRDGNIWAGAGDGLIRLRKPRVKPMTNLGLVEAVASTADGTVWAATADALLSFARNARDAGSTPLLPTGARIRAMRSDTHGSLWVVTDAGVLRLGDDPRWFRIAGGAARLSRVSAVAPAPGGALWLSERDHGLLRWDPRRPDEFEPVAEFATLKLTSLFPDRRGRLWFASAAGRLGMLDESGTVHSFGPQEGLTAGPYLTVFEDSRHVIWVGSYGGLSRFDGARFVRFNQAPGFRGGVSSILEDADHDLWLATASGIVCARRDELDKAIADPSHMVSISVFDAADGLAGMPISFGGPSTVLARDGRLWFVTGRGLTSLDPRSLKQPRRPAPVKIERVVVDERTLPAGSTVSLPARTARLEIDYTALDLTTAMNTRFKYRLEGFDAEWIDAGTRREALYTHLPPRSYRFHVVANTTDGSWTEASAVWDFSIQPMFYQTYLFASLCAVALGVGGWSVWQLRVRRIRRQFALLIGERVRLSREIHDTLLQSLVGVALQFDGLSGHLDPSSPIRQELVRMRKQVEEYIRDARQSIWNLRTPRLDMRDLATAMRESAERAAAGLPVDVEFAQHGVPQASSAATGEQLLRICHEAVRNSAIHAHASVVSVDLRYDPESVVLRVADNGRGFDATRHDTSASGGHYGLVSMRERAEQAGGVLVLTTAPHAGTVIEARIPMRASS